MTKEEKKKAYQKAYQKAYREANKDKEKAYQKAYREANKDKISAHRKAYYEANKDKIQAANKAYQKERMKNDPVYKFKRCLRSNISDAFNRKGYKKNTKTFDILGCDYDTFIKHIESKFSKGMTLDNYGEWHLDHQIPLSKAETEEEVVELCHYTNYQPLWWRENIEKSDKVRLENISFTNKARYIKFLNRI